MEILGQMIAVFLVSVVLALIPTASFLIFADRRWPAVFVASFAGAFAILAVRALIG